MTIRTAGIEIAARSRGRRGALVELRSSMRVSIWLPCVIGFAECGPQPGAGVAADISSRSTP